MALHARRMESFRVDPAFESGSVAAAEWRLCHVRLQDDVRFPWLILIPRRAGVAELEDLGAQDRIQLMTEIVEAGERVRSLGALAGRTVHKLNTAALGNVTPQLHVHVLGRRTDDELWPDPVWGRGPARRYQAEALRQALAVLDPVVNR